MKVQLYYSLDGGRTWILAGIYPSNNDAWQAQYSIQGMNFGKPVQFQQRYV